MSDNNNTKSVITGLAMLAGAYGLGRKHGREKCVNEFKDIMLEKLIAEKKEKGS